MDCLATTSSWFDRHACDARLAHLFHEAQDAIYIYPLDEHGYPGKVEDVNETACQKLGYTREELLQCTMLDIVDKSMHRRVEEWYAALRGGQAVTFESLHQPKSGPPIPFEVSMRAVEFGALRYVMSICRDITERKCYERRLYVQANFEANTGFPNECWIRRHADRLASSLKEGEMLLLIAASIENYYVISDSYGSEIAQRVMFKTLRRIQLEVPNAWIGQTDRDEMLMVLPVCEQHLSAQSLHTVRNILNRAMVADHGLLRLRGHLGVHEATRKWLKENGSAEAVEAAFIALHAAEKANTLEEHYYTPQIADAARDRQRLYSEFLDALEHEKLKLVYQPLFAADNRLFGAEALLRWPIADGFIPPDVFIPMAEQTGTIHLVGEYVLRHACAEFSAWLKRWPGYDFKLMVNMSVHELGRDGVVERMVDILRRTDVSPECLKVEVTETVMLDRWRHLPVLSRLKDLGMHIAIDDFGTGYSSLQYLQDIAPHVVKIDKSFISGSARSPSTHKLPSDSSILPDPAQVSNPQIVASLIQLAKCLHIQTVAEGVETEQQLEWLKQQGCDGFQGYLLGRPVEASTFFRVHAAAALDDLALG